MAAGRSRQTQMLEEKKIREQERLEIKSRKEKVGHDGKGIEEKETTKRKKTAPSGYMGYLIR